MVKMACEREEESFMRVAAVVLLMLPLSSKASISEASATCSSITPWMEIEPSFSSLMDTTFYLILHSLNFT